MKKISNVSLENLGSWQKYQPEMCASCQAWCCKLPVEASPDDLIRLKLVDEYEVQEKPKKVAKKLKAQGIIKHYNFKNNLFTLQQKANGDCLFLDSQGRKCKVYKDRPQTCINHPVIGPKNGFCAYIEKSDT